MSQPGYVIVEDQERLALAILALWRAAPGNGFAAPLPDGAEEMLLAQCRAIAAGLVDQLIPPEGAKGEKGDKGETGAQGNPGSPGTPGATPAWTREDFYGGGEPSSQTELGLTYESIEATIIITRTGTGGSSFDWDWTLKDPKHIELTNPLGTDHVRVQYAYMP